jgi:hypothetical protein
VEQRFVALSQVQDDRFLASIKCQVEIFLIFLLMRHKAPPAAPFAGSPAFPTGLPD